jgi:hypothetical protein
MRVSQETCRDGGLEVPRDPGAPCVKGLLRPVRVGLRVFRSVAGTADILYLQRLEVMGR